METADVRSNLLAELSSYTKEFVWFSAQGGLVYLFTYDLFNDALKTADFRL
jgi:hypothetical protein